MKKFKHLARRAVLGSALYGTAAAVKAGVAPGFPAWLTPIAPDEATCKAGLGTLAYSYLLMIARTSGNRHRVMQRMAEFFCQSGLPDYGLQMYEALLASYGKPEDTPEALIVSYLQMLMFGSPEIQTHEKIHRQHVYWSQRFKSDRPYTSFPNPPAAGRRLKVGYTIHFITNSTSTTQLQPLIRAHHRDRVEVFMYSDEPVETMTDSVRGLVEHWRDTAKLSTEEFCDLVRKDGIDVLNELNGHGIFNRYPAIGRKAAPVQVSWYNYASTTGVPGMDYVLTSDDIEIEALQPYYSETIIRKRGTSHAMTIGSHFPALTSSPFERSGFITFCSFGQAHKVSRTQVLLWCEVMKRVPGSKFFMKAQSLGHPALRAAYIHHFRDGGIGPERLILEGNSDYATLLKCYERVDIGLDTYPHNAGTTTIESTLMGIPVISLSGARYSSQVGRSILEAAGHAEFLCKSREEFIEKAVSLATDPARLSNYRRTLRDDFKRSSRCDIDKFMHELEDCYEEMWRRYETTGTRAKTG